MNRAPGALARPLTLFDVTCLGINAIVGSSIFLFPGRLAGFLGGHSILAFGLTGLMLLAVGLCFAEASSRFDRAGGPYLYAREAFGETTGFAIGWMCWASNVFAWSAVANAVASYLGYFNPALAGTFGTKATAAVVISGLAILNYRGVKLGAWASDFFTFSKLLPLSIFVLLGLPYLNLDAFRIEPAQAPAWGSACFLAYFAYQGFEVVPVPAGETDRPQRNIPLAVVGSLIFATLFYMMIQLVALSVYPGLAESPRPLADAAAAFLGPWGAAAIALGAVFSTIGFNSGCALGGPRYLVALAEHRQLFPALAESHPRFNTPYRAVLANSSVALLMALLLDFNRLVDFSNVVVCAQYIATCLAIPLLRRGPAPQGSFVLPGGLLIPIAGTLATLWLGAQGGWAPVFWALVLLAVGFILKRTTTFST